MTAKEKIAQQVQQMIESRGAKLASHQEEILRLSSPVLRLTSVQEEDHATLGNCRIGGSPDLPAGMDYPEKDGKYYRFIAQLNFSEMPDTLGLLPEKGMLYLFTGDPFSNEGLCVFYDGDDTLVHQEPPADMECYDPYQEEEGNFNAQKARFDLSYEIGWSDALEEFDLISEPNDKPFASHIAGTAFGDDKEGIYAAIETSGSLRYTVLFLGKQDQEKYWIPQRQGILAGLDDKIAHPEKYNNDSYRVNLEYMKELRRQFLAFDENRAYHREHYNDVVCILSLESLSECNMIWGDMGFLNFYLLKNDLINRNFDKIWVEVSSF